MWFSANSCLLTWLTEHRGHRAHQQGRHRLRRHPYGEYVIPPPPPSPHTPPPTCLVLLRPRIPLTCCACVLQFWSIRVFFLRFLVSFGMWISLFVSVSVNCGETHMLTNAYFLLPPSAQTWSPTRSLRTRLTPARTFCRYGPCVTSLRLPTPNVCAAFSFLSSSHQFVQSLPPLAMPPVWSR